MLALNKKVTIEKIDINKFISYSSNYTFYGKGKTISLAIKDLERKIKNYDNEQKYLIKSGLKGDTKNLRHIPSTENTNISFKQKNNFIYDLSLFGIKSLCVILIISAIGFAVSKNIEKSLNTKVEEITFTIKKQVSLLNQQIETEIQKLRGLDNNDLSFMEKIEREIYRGARAEQELEPERVEKIVKSLDIIVERYRPFMKSLGGLFKD